MLAPLDGSDWDNSPATGDFYFQASDGLVTLPAAGYDYDIDWTPMSAGLAPAGMAASFAALAHQAARQSVFTVWEHRGQRMAGRQRRELFHAPVVEGTVADYDRTNALLQKSGR